MTSIVTVEQWPDPIRARTGQTILAAATAAGAPYPHGCRSGNCGACKSRLIAGEVALAPHSDYALTAAERADGLILACRATPLDRSRAQTSTDRPDPAPIAAPLPPRSLR